MNKNTVAGAVQEAGGKVRAAVYHAVGDHEGEAQGRKDQVAGNIKKNIGKLQDAVNE